MIKKLSAKLCFLSIVGLTCSNISLGVDLVSGGLQNSGNSGPSTIILNLIYSAMDATMLDISQYVTTNQKCPPTKYFSKQTTTGFSLYNGNNCDVIVQFGSNVPGTLQGKVIRMVVKSSGAYPSPSSFSQRASITNIDFGSNGTDPSFLKNPLRPYQWSFTMQASSFGNAASAPFGTVMNSSYDQITTGSAAANPSTSPGSTSTSQNSTTIG